MSSITFVKAPVRTIDKASAAEDLPPPVPLMLHKLSVALADVPPLPPEQHEELRRLMGVVLGDAMQLLLMSKGTKDGGPWHTATMTWQDGRRTTVSGPDIITVMRQLAAAKAR